MSDLSSPSKAAEATNNGNAKLYKSDKYTDITMKFEGKTWKLHRSVV